MKKISLGLTLLIVTIGASAQDAKFGIKAGLNISSTSNSNGGESGTRLGPHAGLLAHIHLSPQIALQPEIMYSSQGGKVGDVNLNLGYINIPLLVQYNFDNGFRLQTGPQVGFLVGVSDKVNGNETNFFSSDDFKTNEFAWSFGLGYLSESGFGVDGRYNLGLSRINDAGTGSTKNRVIQLGLFYMFDHKHKTKSR